MNTLTQNWYAISKAYINKATGKTEAEAFIYDEIGAFGIGAKQFIDDIKELGEVKTLHLRINSPGGSVIEGNAIYNALKRNKASVIVHIDGLAASMASIIAMAGDEIEIAENAFFMIHNPSTVSWGESKDLRKDADLMDRMRQNAINAYVQRTGLTEDEVSEMLDAETWIDAEEAVEMNFADRIESRLDMAASISHMNAMLSKMGKEIPKPKIDNSTTNNMATLTKVELSAKVEELEAEKETLSAKVSELETTATQLAEVTTEKDALSEKLETVEAELGAAKRTIDEKTEAFDAEEADRVSLETQLSEKEEALATEQAEVERLKGLIGGSEFKKGSNEGDYVPSKEARDKRITEYAKERNIPEHQAVVELSRKEPELWNI